MEVRCFVAVHVAPPVSRSLEQAQVNLRRTGAAVKWVAGHQFHFTLKFLGEIEAARVAACGAALERAAAGVRTFRLEVHGLGHFGPRVIWAGVREGAEALSALAARVDREMEKDGFPREQRRFSPHLTLGRVREGGWTPALGEAIRAAQDRPFGAYTVREVYLMRSELTREGPIYTSLSAVSLGA